MACARPGASLVPVMVEPPELPVAEDPLEVVEAIELIVEELTRIGL